MSDVFSFKSDLKPGEVDKLRLAHYKDKLKKERLGSVRNLIQDIFGSGFTVAPLAATGTFHVLFEANRNDKNFIIKTSISDPIFSLSFASEKLISQKLADFNFSYYTIYTIDCTRSQYDFDYMIMDKIEGKPLADILIYSADSGSVLTRFGSVLSKFHTIDITGFGHLSVRDGELSAICDTWKCYINTNLVEHIHYCFEMSIITLKQREMIEGIFTDSDHLFNIMDSKLLHGDLSNQNILVNSDIVNIIDWGDAIAGDPIYDLAMWGSFVGNNDKLKYLIDGYYRDTKIPEDFQHKYWIYYLRIIIAKTVHRHVFNYHLSDKIPAIDRILQPIIELSKFE